MAAINQSIAIKETGTYVAGQCPDRLATATAKSGPRGPTSASKNTTAEVLIIHPTHMERK